MRAHGLVRLGIGLLLFLAMVQAGYGQERNYATLAPSSDRNGATILAGLFGDYTPTTNNSVARIYDAPNAANPSESNFTRLEASNLNILGLVQWSGEAWVQMKFDTMKDANSTTFVRIDAPTKSGGLSVDLLETIGGLLGLLDKQVIIPEIYTYATSSLNETKLADEHVSSTIVKDEHGNLYLAVTATQAYNSIRVKLRNQGSLLGLGLGSTLTLNVYHAFTLSGSVCRTGASFTDLGNVEGISLNLLGELIANPHYAINSNPLQYASFSSGVLGVGVASTISQTIYFDHVASEHDAVNIKLALGSGLLSLSLLDLDDAITFVGYNGTTEVEREGLGTLIQLLGLDIADLISIGGGFEGADVLFRPEDNFDRVKIEFNPGLVELGVLSDALRVYNVSLAPSMPEILEPGQPEDLEVCEGEMATFMVDATVPEGELSYQWQYLDGSNWVDINTEGTNASLVLTNVLLSDNGNKYRVLVTGGNAECLQTIASTEANLEVYPKPGKPHLTISDVIN